MIYRKKDTATRTATEEATSSQISRTMPPTHLHKNNASIPRSTLLITVAYEYNSSLCILKNPAKRARRSETTSIPVCICNLFSRRKKKTRKCMATTLPFKDIKVRMQLWLTTSLLLIMRMMARKTAFHLQGATAREPTKSRVQVRLYCTTLRHYSRIKNSSTAPRPNRSYNWSFHCTLRRCLRYSASWWPAKTKRSSLQIICGD